MTVNERLSACGLLARWDEAVAGRDRQTMVSLLLEVALGEAQAAQTVDAVLRDPGRYGF